MSDEPVASSELLAARRSKLDALRAEGVDPFPHEFEGVEPIASVRAAHASLATRRGDVGLPPHRRPPRRAARSGQDGVPGSGRSLRSHPAPSPSRRARRGRDAKAAGARPRGPDRVDGIAFSSRRGELSLRITVVRGAREVAAAAAREASRADRRGDPLPPPRARPDRQRGRTRAVRDPRAGDLGGPPLARRSRVSSRWKRRFCSRFMVARSPDRSRPTTTRSIASSTSGLRPSST